MSPDAHIHVQICTIKLKSMQSDVAFPQLRSSRFIVRLMRLREGLAAFWADFNRDLPVLWYSKRKKGSVWNVCQWVFLPPLASKRTGERAWSLSAVVGRVWGRAARRKGWIERRTPLKRLRLSRPNPSLRSAAFFHAKRNIRSFCRQFSGSKHGYLGFHGTNSFPGRRAQLQKFRIVRFLSYFN